MSLRTCSGEKRHQRGKAAKRAVPVGLDWWRLAERVIRNSGRQRPADAVLRSELRSEAHVPPEIATRVSQGVFVYFRWRGWLEGERPLRWQIDQALVLAERYAIAPADFNDAELLARAIPSWVSGLIETPVAWVRSLQGEPQLWLRAQRGQGRRLAEKLGDTSVFGEGVLSDILRYHGQIDLYRTAEFHAGQFELQDLSSQVVGLVCNPQPGEKWWDACAGEGGKTLHLARLMENKGLIWSSDRAAWRLAKLKRRAARAGVFNYRTLQWDGGAATADQNGVRWGASCCAVQRSGHVAAKSTCAVDDGNSRRAGTWRSAGPAPGKRVGRG